MLVLKLLLAPLLVVGSSLAGRRWGARVAGMLVAFPIVAGPILLITALEQGVRFGARAASASLLGLVSLALFVVVFAHAGRRWGWLPTLLVSWGVTLTADLLLSRLVVGAWWGLALVLVAAWVAHRVLAPFPTAISVVVAFVLAQQGPDAAVRTLIGVARGLVGFAVFCFLVAVLLVPLGVAGAFVIALAAPLLWAGWESRRRFSRSPGV